MSDKMREEFEAWAVKTKDRFGLPFFISKDDQGQYVDNATEISWQAWQASRAAIVVDLSYLCEASYAFSGTCYKSDVEYRLDEAGVSYK